MKSLFQLKGPAARGAGLALASAVLFGLSTPLVQRFGVAIGPFSTAALLYLGAACVALLTLKPASEEAALTRRNLPRLVGMAAMGAVLGPVALAWGLQRTSGASASLMLTLEAVFTALLAWVLYGESMDKRVALAMLLLLAGGATLVLDQGSAGQGAHAGPAGGAAGHSSLGCGQRAVARRGRPRSGAGGWRQIGAGRDGNADAGCSHRRGAAALGCGAGPDGRGRHRLRPELAAVCAGSARFWRFAHRLGVRLCAFCGFTGRVCAGRAFPLFAGAGGGRAHAVRRVAARE